MPIAVPLLLFCRVGSAEGRLLLLDRAPDAVMSEVRRRGSTVKDGGAVVPAVVLSAVAGVAKA